MSEEEINEAIERLEYFEPDDLIECAMYRECIRKICGLLDLYQKEKEKNKKLEKILTTGLYACDIDKNKECKKNNCYINGGECAATTDITKVKYINLDDYISKNKIIEKANWYKDALKYDCNGLEDEYKHILKVLQELLEEE
jgi:hypothetical protein